MRHALALSHRFDIKLRQNLTMLCKDHYSLVKKTNRGADGIAVTTHRFIEAMSCKVPGELIPIGSLKKDFGRRLYDILGVLSVTGKASCFKSYWVILFHRCFETRSEASERKLLSMVWAHHQIFHLLPRK